MPKPLLRLAVLFLLAAAGAGLGANIIVNPSFEQWLLGMPVGWLTSNPIAESSVVRDTLPNSGTYCARLAGSDSVAFVATTTIVRPGYHYEFSGYARVPGMLPGSFILEFTTLLAQPIGTPVVIPAIYSGSSYRRYTRWLTAPESSAFIVVTFATLPNGTAWVDDVTLEDTAIAGIGTEPSRTIPLSSVRTRKLVVAPGQSVRLDPGTRALDLTGRPAALPLKPGIYFLTAARRRCNR